MQTPTNNYNHNDSRRRRQTGNGTRHAHAQNNNISVTSGDTSIKYACSLPRIEPTSVSTTALWRQTATLADHRVLDLDYFGGTSPTEDRHPPIPCRTTAEAGCSSASVAAAMPKRRRRRSTPYNQHVVDFGGVFLPPSMDCRRPSPFDVSTTNSPTSTSSDDDVEHGRSLATPAIDGAASPWNLDGKRSQTVVTSSECDNSKNCYGYGADSKKDILHRSQRLDSDLAFAALYRIDGR